MTPWRGFFCVCYSLYGKALAASRWWRNENKPPKVIPMGYKDMERGINPTTEDENNERTTKKVCQAD
jgi:hypothetical protein